MGQRGRGSGGEDCRFYWSGAAGGEKRTGDKDADVTII
jgi:hypothetical protein